MKRVRISITQEIVFVPFTKLAVSKRDLRVYNSQNLKAPIQSKLAPNEVGTCAGSCRLLLAQVSTESARNTGYIHHAENMHHSTDRHSRCHSPSCSCRPTRTMSLPALLSFSVSSFHHCCACCTRTCCAARARVCVCVCVCVRTCMRACGRALGNECLCV